MSYKLKDKKYNLNEVVNAYRLYQLILKKKTVQINAILILQMMCLNMFLIIKKMNLQFSLLIFQVFLII
jgi:hypothetical protein